MFWLAVLLWHDVLIGCFIMTWCFDWLFIVGGEGWAEGPELSPREGEECPGAEAEWERVQGAGLCDPDRAPQIRGRGEE